MGMYWSNPLSVTETKISTTFLEALFLFRISTKTAGTSAALASIFISPERKL